MEPAARALIPRLRYKMDQVRKGVITDHDFAADFNAINKSILNLVSTLKSHKVLSILGVDTSNSNVNAKPTVFVARDLYRLIYSAQHDSDKAGVLIKANALRKSFGSSFGLGPLDITLLRGEVLGLVGVNASGKTTILRVNHLTPFVDLLCQDKLTAHREQVYLIRTSDGRFEIVRALLSNPRTRSRSRSSGQFAL
jgi:hypothetical protein